MFCAPRRILEPRTALATSLNAVNGGQTAMSTVIIFASSIFKSCTKLSASATVLFIFQFPAMMSFRSLFMSTLYCSHHQKTSGLLKNLSESFDQAQDERREFDIVGDFSVHAEVSRSIPNLFSAT